MSVFDDELREEFLDDTETGTDASDSEGSEEIFEHYRFDVDKGQTPLRVDKYLASHMEYTSRHRIQLAIKKEYIRLTA